MFGLHFLIFIFRSPSINSNRELDRFTQNVLTFVRVFLRLVLIPVRSRIYRVNLTCSVSEIKCIDVLATSYPSETGTEAQAKPPGFFG